MIDKNKFDKLNESVENMKNVMNNFGISVSEASNQFTIFSDTIKSIKNRYHPVIYWMYEIGILKD